MPTMSQSQLALSHPPAGLSVTAISTQMPNAKATLEVLDGCPHIFIQAIEPINVGDEMMFDYGDRSQGLYLPRMFGKTPLPQPQTKNIPQFPDYGHRFIP